MVLDEAIDLAAGLKGLPVLGGPSGKGWSFYSRAQQCPHLFYQAYVKTEEGDRRAPHYLQIGGLWHSLLALYYAAQMKTCAYMNRGLIRSDLIVKNDLFGAQLANIRPAAPEMLLLELKRMAERAEKMGKPQLAPNMSLVYEAERLFDAHANYYGDGREDLEPLAVEWFARHPELGYTCRYDAIVRVGRNDPKMPEGVFILEHKTAAYLSESVTEGWVLDGEILGQLMLWKPSGMEERFGPLRGICIDIVTKAKVPKFHRVVLPADLPPVKRHEHWIRVLNAEIAMWQATGVYTQRFVSCFSKFGMCPEFRACERLAWRSA